MNRIDQTFADLKAQGRKALVIYLTAGDPDAETSFAMMTAAAGHGADVIELGLPFSDPTADGPVIQRASQRAKRRAARTGRARPAHTHRMFWFVHIRFTYSLVLASSIFFHSSSVNGFAPSQTSG